MKNLDIRMTVSENGLKYKDIAKELNISPEWLSRLMRNTLTNENKVRIMGAIEKLRKGVNTKPDCNKCIWSTRDCGCVSWECDFISHEDARRMIEEKERRDGENHED